MREKIITLVSDDKLKEIVSEANRLTFGITDKFPGLIAGGSVVDMLRGGPGKVDNDIDIFLFNTDKANNISNTVSITGIINYITQKQNGEAPNVISQSRHAVLLETTLGKIHLVHQNANEDNKGYSDMEDVLSSFDIGVSQFGITSDAVVSTQAGIDAYNENKVSFVGNQTNAVSWERSVARGFKYMQSKRFENFDIESLFQVIEKAMSWKFDDAYCGIEMGFNTKLCGSIVYGDMCPLGANTIANTLTPQVRAYGEPCDDDLLVTNSSGRSTGAPMNDEGMKFVEFLKHYTISRNVIHTGKSIVETAKFLLEHDRSLPEKFLDMNNHSNAGTAIWCFMVDEAMKKLKEKSAENWIWLAKNGFYKELYQNVAKTLSSVMNGNTEKEQKRTIYKKILDVLSNPSFFCIGNSLNNVPFVALDEDIDLLERRDSREILGDVSKIPHPFIQSMKKMLDNKTCNILANKNGFSVAFFSGQFFDYFKESSIRGHKMSIYDSALLSSVLEKEPYSRKIIDLCINMENALSNGKLETLSEKRDYTLRSVDGMDMAWHGNEVVSENRKSSDEWEPYISHIEPGDVIDDIGQGDIPF